MPLKKVLYFFVALWLIVTYNSQWTETAIPGIGIGVNLALEGILLILTIPTLFSRFSFYKKWAVVLLVFWGISVTWSVSAKASTAFLNFSLPYIIAFGISSFINTKADVEKMLFINIIAAVLCGIYLLLFVNAGSVTETRLGGSDDGLETVWNANDIGIKMSMGYAFCVYFLLNGSRVWSKKVYLSFILFLFSLSILSGSRSVVLLIVAFTAILMIARTGGRKKILYSIVAFSFVIVAYLAMMNVPVLYDIVGSRFEKMNEGLSGGDGGFSMDIRSLMIVSGLSWFLEKPLLGYGYNGFSALFYRLTGIEVYSHNNFIEMLVNSGIVGFCIYYSLTIFILIRLRKPALQNKEPLALVFFVFTIVATLSDYVVISYVNTPYIVRMMVTAMYCKMIHTQDTIIIHTR